MVLEGLKVVDFSAYIAGPGAAGILADWGAEVIKVEPFNGDPMRAMVSLGPDGVNPPFDLDNRGKRSVSFDIGHPDGLGLLMELVDRADVFLTNLRPVALEQLGIDPDTLLGRNPRLVVASITGFGHHSPHRDRPSYDIGGFWARSGGAACHAVDGAPPPTLRGGYGDHLTASGLADGIAAALYERHTSGRGQHVTTSLARTGMYGIAQDFHVLQRAGTTFPVGVTREHASNPMLNSYCASDGRWFWLLGLQPDRQWASVLAAIERPDLSDDERFTSLLTRRANAAALIEVLDAAFATLTRDEWEQRFVEHGVWYEPVLTVPEAFTDDVIAAAGAFIEIDTDQGPVPAIATPIDFSRTAQGPVQVAPGLGDDTDEVLAELGYDTERIIEMKVAGAVL